MDGGPYTRTGRIETLLKELKELPRAELVARCQIADRNAAGHVPSECLMYFVRATRQDNSDQHFEQLYKILLSRLRRALPNPETRNGEVDPRLSDQEPHPGDSL